MLSPHDEAWRDRRAEQLNNVRQVILVPRVGLAGVRVEQVVAGCKFESQACGAPDVCRVRVRNSQEHLDGAILTRLNVVGEVIMLRKREIIEKSRDKGRSKFLRQSTHSPGQRFSHARWDC